MTYSLLLMEDNQPRKVIGTVWANEESIANTMARAFVPAQHHDKLIVRQTEQREIPMRIEQ
jgi:hypothetical protein